MWRHRVYSSVVEHLTADVAASNYKPNHIWDMAAEKVRRASSALDRKKEFKASLLT